MSKPKLIEMDHVQALRQVIRDMQSCRPIMRSTLPLLVELEQMLRHTVTARIQGSDSPGVYRAEGKFEILETLYEQLQLKENEGDDQARTRRRHAKDKRPVWCSECLWSGPRAEAVFDNPLRCPGCDSKSLLPGEGPP